MGDRNCCVRNCRRRSHDHRGRKIPNGLTFHCFPAWRRREGGRTSELTRRRRAAWVAAVGRANITFNHIPPAMRVCSRHFRSGKPAYEMLESDPDWVPSLHLGHGEGDRRRTERLLPSERSERKQRQQRWAAETSPPDVSRTPQRGSGKPAFTSEESERDQRQQRLTAQTRPSDAPRTPQRESAGVCRVTGPVRRAVLPSWRVVKSQLQSVLRRHTDTNQQPGDEPSVEQPAAVQKMDSFRVFFRDALEASLEAFSRSRSLSARQPSVSRDYEVELNFKHPHVKKENHPRKESSTTSTSSSSSSSSCLNCVRLQTEVKELQEKLTRQTGEQEDKEASGAPHTAPLEPDGDLQSPETVHTEESESEWTEPLSPAQVVSRVGEEDNRTPAGSSDPPERKDVRRFRKGWLNMFWFLRYSPTLDQMWCHVCRLHADKTHHNMSLIKGSRMFRMSNIRKHSYSNYHRESEERYMNTCDLKT